MPPDHRDNPVDVDEEILVEVWDAICQADACVRDDMNDLFLKHPNMRVLDGFGKDAWTVKRIRVPGDGFCVYRALQVALHRDGTIDELTCTALIRTGSHRCERRPSLGRCKFLLSFVFCFLSGVVG